VTQKHPTTLRFLAVFTLLTAVANMATIAYVMTSYDGVVGKYYVRNETFWVSTDGEDPISAMQTCAHEVGHYVWFEHLDQDQRDEYREIYNVTEDWVSAYAETDVEEDFAETLQAYIWYEPYSLAVPVDRRQFFEDEVYAEVFG